MANGRLIALSKVWVSTGPGAIELLNTFTPKQLVWISTSCVVPGHQYIWFELVYEHALAFIRQNGLPRNKLDEIAFELSEFTKWLTATIGTSLFMPGGGYRHRVYEDADSVYIELLGGQ